MLRFNFPFLDIHIEVQLYGIDASMYLETQYLLLFLSLGFGLLLFHRLWVFFLNASDKL